MKRKTLLKILSSGINKRFSPQESARITERVTEIYDDCCRAHQGDPPAVKQHTEGMIYAGVALYRGLQETGMTPEQALAMTDEIFEDYARAGAEKLRTLLKLPGLYRQVPCLFCKVVPKKYSAEAGFRMTFYDQGKGCARFDVTACPYYNTCTAMGCPELTTIFCNTDDCCYGAMHPKLQWHRTTTIGRGGDCCDFEITVKD